MMKAVHGTVSIDAIAGPLELQAAGVQQPFLRLTFDDGTVMQVTIGLAEMIGSAGKGLRERQEDMIRRAHS